MSSNSNNFASAQNNINYVKKEQVQKIKRNLLDKILRDIKNKYLTILEDKRLNLNDFSQKILKEIDDVYKSKDSDYIKLFRKIENYILKNLSKYDDVKRENIMEKKEVDIIIKGNNNQIDETDQQFHICCLPEGKIKRNIFRSALKKREDDGWAKIILNNKKKFEEQENQNLKDNICKKYSYKNELDQIVNNKMELENKMKINEKQNLDNCYYPMEETLGKLDYKKIYENINSENKKNVKLLKETSEFYNKLDQELEKERIQKSIQDDAKNEENLKRKRQYELELQNFLRKQIEDKKQSKLKSNLFKEDERNKICELINEESKLKQNLGQSIKNMKQAYKKDLDNQIKMKKEIPSMSPVEELINKKLLYS
jgi:hypothetical protein